MKKKLLFFTLSLFSLCNLFKTATISIQYDQNTFIRSLYNLPKITTKRLILRKMNLKDAPDLFEILKRKDVTQYLHYEPFESIEKAVERINDSLSKYTKGQASPWAIIDKKTKKMIGFGGFIYISPDKKTGEINGIIHPDHWGKNIMIEAGAAFCLFGFEKLDLSTIKTFVRSDNQQCINLHKKQGFKVTNTITLQQKDNSSIQKYEFSLFKQDFLKLYKKAWMDLFEVIIN